MLQNKGWPIALPDQTEKNYEFQCNEAPEFTQKARSPPGPGRHKGASCNSYTDAVWGRERSRADLTCRMGLQGHVCLSSSTARTGTNSSGRGHRVPPPPTSIPGRSSAVTRKALHKACTHGTRRLPHLPVVPTRDLRDSGTGPLGHQPQSAPAQSVASPSAPGEGSGGRGPPR